MTDDNVNSQPRNSVSSDVTFGFYEVALQSSMASWSLLRHGYYFATILNEAWSFTNVIKGVLSVVQFIKYFAILYRIYVGHFPFGNFLRFGKVLSKVFGFQLALVGLLSLLITFAGVIKKGFTLFTTVQLINMMFQFVYGQGTLNLILAAAAALLCT